MPATAEIITLEDGIAKMAATGYDEIEMAEIFVEWLNRGDDVIIFENRDLGHREVGHRLAMPWYPDEPDPRQAPDNNATGLGWRYPPAYRIKSPTPHNNQR